MESIVIKSYDDLRVVSTKKKILVGLLLFLAFISLLLAMFQFVMGDVTEALKTLTPAPLFVFLSLHLVMAGKFAMANDVEVRFGDRYIEFIRDGINADDVAGLHKEVYRYDTEDVQSITFNKESSVMRVVGLSSKYEKLMDGSNCTVMTPKEEYTFALKLGFIEKEKREEVISKTKDALKIQVAII